MIGKSDVSDVMASCKARSLVFRVLPVQLRAHFAPTFSSAAWLLRLDDENRSTV